MFNKLAKIFNKPESGKVKLKFIALDEEDNPYEDVAIVPYSDGYDEAVIQAKFRNFMRLRKHLVVEIVIEEKLPD
jgi:hypothetical protein